MKFQFTSNGIYDKLKWTAQIGLPTLAGLYFALSGIWGLPAVEQIVGTISLVDAALGGLLGLSTKNYVPPVDGHVLLDSSNPEYLKLHVQVDKQAEDVKVGDQFTLKVVPHPSPQIPAPPSPHQI
jgi:Putative phage holin Dp-1